MESLVQLQPNFGIKFKPHSTLKKMPVRLSSLTLKSSQNSLNSSKESLHKSLMTNVLRHSRDTIKISRYGKSSLQKCNDILAQSQDCMAALQVLHPHLHELVQQKITTLTNDLQSHELRLKTLDRVNAEMKKLLANQQEEIEKYQQYDSYQVVQNYQSLITEYSSLYDHYKAQKLQIQKIRTQLDQSCFRERQFVELLKCTEMSQQADLIAKEFDLLFNDEGHSRDPDIGGSGAVVRIGEQTIPKLSFQVITAHNERKTS